VSQNLLDRDVANGIAGMIGLGVVALFIASLFWLAIPVGILLCGYAAYRIYQTSDAVQERKARELTHKLYAETRALLPAIPDESTFIKQIYRAIPGERGRALDEALLCAALELFELEGWHRDGLIPPPTVCNSIEGARYRDYLAEYSQKAVVPHIADIAAETIVESFTALLDQLPPMPRAAGLTFEFSLQDFTRDRHGALVEALVLPYYDSESKTLGLFKALREQLDRNLYAASVAASGSRRRESPDLVMPSQYEGDDLLHAYLKDTPLLQIFEDATVPLSIPDKVRFEHAWILAPQGTGKTQLIQYLASCDLDRVARDEASVMVMDSQGDLINEISTLKVFAPGEPLHEKLIIIEPDIEYPPALNVFDLGKGRLDAYSARDREQLANSTIDLLAYVFDALLGEGGAMTTKQSTLYRYVIRLLMEVPEATLDTFSDLLKVEKPADLAPYQPFIARLHKPAQEFFARQFLDRQFSETKRQVAWRLASLMENTVFARMFSFPKSKIDLFTELNAAKVILINTDRNLLGDHRTAVFGRFFIAMLLSAAEERAVLERANRLPVFCYIDEVHDYISHDTKIAQVLDQARKRNIAMALAHQRSKQIELPNVLDALATTSIKFASTDNAGDASLLARSMNTTAKFVATQPERHFALHVRRQTQEAVSIKVPFFVLEDREHMSKAERIAVRDRMRAKYATRHASQKEVDDRGPTPCGAGTPSAGPTAPAAPPGAAAAPGKRAAENTALDVDTAATDW
jgi:hypothetical protein